jgi:cytochrome c-type biogenesis protein CcmE
MKNRLKNQRIRFVITIFLLSVFSLFLIIKNFKNNLVFFYKPSELLQYGDNRNYRKKIRIGGLVKEGSFMLSNNQDISFVITDYQAEIIIHYRGILPDLFREKQGVVASGFFNYEKNIFTAQELLIKHDENYMPPEIENIQVPTKK